MHPAQHIIAEQLDTHPDPEQAAATILAALADAGYIVLSTRRDE